MNRPLFAQLLGEDFERLPPALRALHSVARRQLFAGQGQVRRGGHPLVAPCAWLARLPPTAAELPVQVEFLVDAGGEQWRRRFGGHPMVSRLWPHRGLLRERLGALRFEFALRVQGDEIHWRARRAWLFGLLPLPPRWFAQVRCREREHAGRYEYLVDVSLPLIGPFIRYEGWLEPR